MLYLATFAVVVGMAGLLSVFVLPNTVYAGGGVGSGGSGGGGGGGSNTKYGWGWVIYSASGPGPTRGFRDGTAWSDVQNACLGSNARTVYAHIIMDNNDTGMIYNYLDIQDWPSQYPGYFGPGWSVDNGNATSIDTGDWSAPLPQPGTAWDAFASLPSYGVDTTGFTFGDNVAWFCYDFGPPPPPAEATVQMQAFKVDATGGYAGEVDMRNAILQTCNAKGNATQVYDSTWAGMVRFKADIGSPFCIRILSPSPPGYGGPFIRPRFEGYNGPSGSCPGYPLGNPWNTTCTDASYEGQVAGGGYGNPDRVWDGGYDLIYVPMSCGGWATDPPGPEAGQPFNFKAYFNYPRGYLEYNMRLNFSTPGITPPPSEKGPFAINSTNNYTASVTWPGLTAAQSGYYSGTYTVLDNTPQRNVLLTCPFNTNPPPQPCAIGGCSLPIATKPYFQLIGGDIASGFGPPTTCPGWGSSGPGTITAWNQASIVGGDPNKGAGTNLAAFALNLIKGFASANSGPPPSGSPPPAGLSFANPAGAPGNPLVNAIFGGGFQGGIGCPADYYATKPATTLPSVPPFDQDVVAYYSNGDLTLGAISNIPGNRPIIYVDGDAYLNGNIAVDNTIATSISDLSNFWLVVKGNIYIEHTVEQLDGVYVAQPVLVDSNGDGDFNDPGESTKGKIYTCYGNGVAIPGSSPAKAPTKNQVATTCGLPAVPTLTVNGAFIAKELKLYRSGGSMLSPGSAAELFNYTPSVWLAPPPPIVNNKTSDSYEAITSLPPVL